MLPRAQKAETVGNVGFPLSMQSKGSASGAPFG
jgi:hypothetical protein